MKIETIITSQTPYFAVALLPWVILLILNHKRWRRPLLWWMTFCAILLSFAIGGAFHQFWVELLNLFFLLILALVFFLFAEKGLLGVKDEAQKERDRKWKEKYPRLSKFHQKHPTLLHGLGYGSVCGFFTYWISLTIMERYKDAWMSLHIRYLKIPEPMASAMVLSEGLNSPLKSLLLIISIWSAAAFATAFVCSLFARDRDAFRMGAIPLLVFCSLMIPAPLTMFQRLILAMACATSAHVASRLCFWDISERLCSLFDRRKDEPVKSEDLNSGEK